MLNSGKCATSFGVITGFCWVNIANEAAAHVTPFITYAIIDKVSIRTMAFLLDDLYQEKNALAKRLKVTTQSP